MDNIPYQTPSEIPAMTLRDVVFSPKAMMPLRILRIDTARCLRMWLREIVSLPLSPSGKMFLPGEDIDEPPFEVATAGVIRVSKKNEDGTSFVLLQGIERLRVRHIVQEEPYRVLKVEPWETVVDGRSDSIREELLTEMKTNKELGGDVTEDVLEYLSPLDDVVAFVDLAAFTLCKHVVGSRLCLKYKKT